MPNKYDAIIIGTGQSGPALAGRLNAEGQKTAIIDRFLLSPDGQIAVDSSAC